MVSSYGEQVGLLYVCNLNHPNQNTREEQHHVPQVNKKQKILVSLNLHILTPRLTFHQLLHAGNFRPVNGINGSDPLRQIYII